MITKTVDIDSLLDAEDARQDALSDEDPLRNEDLDAPFEVVSSAFGHMSLDKAARLLSSGFILQ